ncbi:MAG TPA: HAD family phosphatase [Gemmatimonadaceae bacterium]|nr:HAD family phosphatase [Gemmatimonadaceae bacterium]
MIRAVLWDNDGVLVDTERLYFEATRRVLADVGIELTHAQYMELFLVQSRGAWHLAAERGHDAAALERLRMRRNRVYSELLADGADIVEGVVPLLESLHGRFTMGIVTSSRRDHFDIIHRSSGLLRFFDFALTADDCTHTKPHPELYQKAVARTGFAASECLAVEDSARGLAAATAAGVKCVVIPTPLTASSDFSGAARVLSRVTELELLLSQLS